MPIIRNLKLTLCYDGTRYNGWQRQGNTENTVQGKLEAILSRMLGESIEVSGCGRTDAGVHARMQVCSFRTAYAESADIMLTELRKYLPEDIGAVSLEEAPDRFHARLSCREKTYLYRIWNSPEPNVFERKYCYSYPERLDEDAMRKAAQLLCGRHDFASFCSLKKVKKSTVRQLKRIEITRNGGELDIMLTGDGFLYNMVRIIVGTLIEVGNGSRASGEISEILSALDRSRAGFTAPAHGLTLWDIRY